MFISDDLYKELCTLTESKIVDGMELPNPIPQSIPTGLNRPLTLQDQIRRLLRQELSEQAEQQGYESFEDSDDFEVDEDPEPFSQYEIRDMQEEYPVDETPSDDAPTEQTEEETSSNDNITPDEQG